MRKTRSGTDVAPDFYERLTTRQVLVEQIKRDVEAAREADEVWWKTFFNLRAASFRALLVQHDAELQAIHDGRFVTKVSEPIAIEELDVRRHGDEP